MILLLLPQCKALNIWLEQVEYDCAMPVKIGNAVARLPLLTFPWHIVKLRLTRRLYPFIITMKFATKIPRNQLPVRFTGSRRTKGLPANLQRHGCLADGFRLNIVHPVNWCYLDIDKV